MSHVLLVSDQPVLLHGLEHVLRERGFAVSVSHGALPEFAPTARPDLALLDLTAGLSFGDLAELGGKLPGCPVVLWSDLLPLDTVFRALSFGVRGIIERSSTAGQLASSLERVAGGEIQIGLAAGPDTTTDRRSAELTPRERQLVGLLQQGLRNKQIADAMDITEGTVKIYIFRLFHKLGVRNRFELAQYGLARHPVHHSPSRVV